MNFHNKPNKYITNVELKVMDLQESKEFYTNILGLTVLFEDDNKIELTTNGVDNILTLIQPDNVTPKNKRSLGLYHFALLLPNKESLASLVFHLIQNGIRFGTGDHLVSEAFYLEDIDGNDLEIYIDRDPSLWTWNNGQVEMATDPIDVYKFIEERSKVPFSKLPEDTIIGHIHLYVSDLEESVKFYTEVLGYNVVSSLGDSARFMSTGKYHHHIAVNTWQGRLAPHPSDNEPGMNSFTIKDGDKTEILKDPDNNTIKFS